MAPAPLPLRDGLDPTRLRLPNSSAWHTVLQYLVTRFPHDAERLREKVAAREVVDGSGVPITERTPFVSHTFVYLYRDPPEETPVPFSLRVLHRDDDLLVVDKPHFLATTPRGAHVVESALVRLRRELESSDISPAHRLDRLTAGVLVFTLRPEIRSAYQSMFAERKVTKTYEAIAPYRADLHLPATVRSRIVKERGRLQAYESEGEPNSETVVEIVERHGGHARYRLTPTTGKTHQLRVHLSSLGIPITGDNFYPTFYDVPADDYSSPLRLLARSLEFDDPLTGLRRTFRSERTLSWPA
ncbi:pseudouridine synthase [Rhodococcus sp. NPDC058521]|uniref:pseudouridine synthase n=1 Tax=Rhodococcus sp. NPDC058521 TaxID=3346536 RepID=UPI003646A8E5